MEKSINKKLKLYFKDADNAQRTVSIDYPKDEYDDATIKSAMDNMINAGVLETKNGKIETKAKAEMETIEKSPYDIEA